MQLLFYTQALSVCICKLAIDAFTEPYSNHELIDMSDPNLRGSKVA